MAIKIHEANDLPMITEYFHGTVNANYFCLEIDGIYMMIYTWGNGCRWDYTFPKDPYTEAPDSFRRIEDIMRAYMGR